MALKSCTRSSFSDFNTEKSIQEVKLPKMPESNLKYNLEKHHKLLLQTNPQLSIRSKNIMWKPRVSVSAELCESSYSPIAKRLYSLVNSNNVSPCQITAPNNNCTPVNFVVSNDIPKAFPKTVNKSTLTENIADVNHSKLRGFFKQISVEKSGLPIKSNFNIINRSLKLKTKKESNTIDQKLKIKESKSPASINSNIISQTSNKLQMDTCTHVKNEIVTLSNSNFKKCLKFTNPIAGLEYNRAFQNTNMNSSNCIDLKFQNQITSNRSLNSSPCSQHTSKSVGPEKNDISDKELSDEYYLKNCSDFNDKKSNNPNNKLNTFASKVQIENQKSALKLENKNKAKTGTIKGCVNEKKSEVNSIVPTGEDLQSRNNSVVNHAQISESIKINYKDSEEKIKYHLSKGDFEIKPKSTLSKKIFKIFSQSGHLSKKSKLIKNSSETVFGITSDNLINLITILSVELILSTTHTKLIQSNERASDSINKSNPTKAFPSKSTLNSITNKKLIKTPQTQIMTPRSAFHKTNTPSKKLTLTFDFNGRVVKEDKNDSQTRLRNYLHHGSLSNLHGMLNKNSSTLSIPVRYSQANQLFRFKNTHFESSDRNSVISSNSRSKNLNKYGPCQDYQINKEREHCKSSFNAKFQEISENRKPNLQQTYQFKPLSENVKTRTKGDNYSSRERLQVKCNRNSLSTSKETNVESNNQKNNKENLNERPIVNNIKEKGNYKFSTQIKTKIDFLMLDDVFELKEELYSNCDKSMIYIRQKDKIKNTNTNLMNKPGNECWFLYIESPTSEALKNSLKIVADKFPEWNLQQYIDY